VGRVLIKRLRQPSSTQEIVLVAFEDEGWPPKIDDPLRPQEGMDQKYRLRATIRSLNTHQNCPLLRFFGDGTGTSVCWEFVHLKGDNTSIVSTRGVRADYARHT
jgi:hypothetical protein